MINQAEERKNKILQLHNTGFESGDIARKLGISQSLVTLRLSELEREGKVKWRRKGHTPRSITIGDSVWAAYAKAAEQRGDDPEHLIKLILLTVVSDDLINAVLDDDRVLQRD